MEFKEIISIISASLGITGLVFGLFQYYKAQKWKKSEFAASLLQQLRNDPELAMCCVFLDWSTRRVPVPEKYKVFTHETSFVHTWELLAEAMSPENEQANFDFPLVMYRDAFDVFFTYLDSVHHYIKNGLFSSADVSSLSYWLDQLREPRYAVTDKSGRKVNPFSKFIEFYNYGGAKAMIAEFQTKKSLP